MLRRKRRDTPSSSIGRAATAGYRCRWHRRSESYSQQVGETARREQRSNLKRELIWPAKLHWGCTGDSTYPSSSGGSPKLQRRPPNTIVESRKRRFMNPTPRSVPRRPRCVRWTPSGGARIGQVSPVQFCRRYSRCLQFEHCFRLVVSPWTRSRRTVAGTAALATARYGCTCGGRRQF